MDFNTGNMPAYKLLYVHGYLGHGNGKASRLLRNEITKRELPVQVDAPQFPVTKPEMMKEMLGKLQAENHYDFAAASSLGAFYLMQEGFPYQILVNAALPSDLKALKEKEPESENSELTEEFFTALQTLLDAFLQKQEVAGADWTERSYLIYGTKDDLAHSEPILGSCIKDKKDHTFHVHMGHRMEQAGAEKICDILEMLIKSKHTSKK